MLTKEQFNILSVYYHNIFAEYTFKQIKELSKQKSNNVIQIALKQFQKEAIITSKITGDVTTYSLNLNNNLTLSYFNLINEHELENKKYPKAVIEEIKNKIFKHTPFFVLSIFGSFAKNKATEKSDLDVALIVESEHTKKEITPFLETIKRREIVNIDYYIFTKNEFLEMLKSDVENLGKQIYKNSLIHYGFIEYTNIIRNTKK